MYPRLSTSYRQQALRILPVACALIIGTTSHAEPLPNQGNLPALTGAVAWLNSPPLTQASLQGKVILVDFWTYGCSNCLNALPSVKGWAAKYKAQGLIVIGVHSPEFAYEKDLGSVQKSVHDLGITYPVALDNNFTLWRAFHNQYWPAQYLIDRTGHIRYVHAGEGDYAQIEQAIQQLLADNSTNQSTHNMASH